MAWLVVNSKRKSYLYLCYDLSYYSCYYRFFYFFFFFVQLKEEEKKNEQCLRLYNVIELDTCL